MCICHVWDKENSRVLDRNQTHGLPDTGWEFLVVYLLQKYALFFNVTVILYMYVQIFPYNWCNHLIYIIIIFWCGGWGGIGQFLSSIFFFLSCICAFLFSFHLVQLHNGLAVHESLLLLCRNLFW